MKQFKIFFIVMGISLAIAFFWDHIPAIKQTVHALLDPVLNPLLNWNAAVGMIIFSAFITLILTLVQKYTTDQKTLREIKKEQKVLQEEIKKFKDNPEKMMELQKKSFSKTMEIMPLTMRPLLYTSVPIILFIRWFGDYFTANPVKIFGLSWIWAYIILSIIFSSIFRKIFNVV